MTRGLLQTYFAADPFDDSIQFSAKFSLYRISDDAKTNIMGNLNLIPKMCTRFFFCSEDAWYNIHE